MSRLSCLSVSNVWLHGGVIFNICKGVDIWVGLIMGGGGVQLNQWLQGQFVQVVTEYLGS